MSSDARCGARLRRVTVLTNETRVPLQRAGTGTQGKSDAPMAAAVNGNAPTSSFQDLARYRKIVPSAGITPQ